jgi:hydrogenase nickel incorporation protein HypA/HybF
MHEYHIVDNIVKQVLEKAAAAKAKKVTKVVLVMGERSGLAESSVRLYFSQLVEGNILEGAELVINKIGAQLECKSCAITFPCQKSNLNCPKCGAQGVPTEKGKEFYIDSIEIES